MKNILLLIIICVLSIVIICFIYFNSEGYRYEYAKKLRDERIAKLNKIRRPYIYEGVYSFDYLRTATTSIKDKYGKWVSIRHRFPAKTGEISFTSKKITISLGNKIEEFSISNPTITVYESSKEHSIKYTFKILNWMAYDGFKWFFQYDTIFNYKYRKIMRMFFYEPTLSLRLNTSNSNSSENNTSELSISESISDYDLSDYDKLGSSEKLVALKDFGVDPDSIPPNDTDTDKGKFIFDMVGSISMDRLNYKYYTSGEPAYVRNADYDNEEYDINNYLYRIKSGGYIKNPFALESTWK